MRSLTELLLVTVGCGVAAFPFGNDNATDKTAPSQQAKAGSQATSADWPQFRGPDGQGHSNAKDLALTWSETTNIKWKRAVDSMSLFFHTIMSGNAFLRPTKEFAENATDTGRTNRSLDLPSVQSATNHAPSL